MIRISAEQSGFLPAHRFSRATLLRISAAFEKHFPDTHGVLQLALVDDHEIQRLNRMYRGKDAVTDVLSFPSSDGALSGVLGDVLLCMPQVERQAPEGDIVLEMTDLLVHGILHVLGYDHERSEDAKIMFPLQDTLVREILTS